MPDPAPIAMIGARAEKLARLPPEWVTLFRRIAIWAATTGREVRTGAASGADQEAAEAALEAGGRVRLYLPDAGHQLGWRGRMHYRYPEQMVEVTYLPGFCPNWDALVHEHHPNPRALGTGFNWSLMARNVGIQVGVSGEPDERVRAVIALPLWENGRAGGTEFGMRLSRALGIPLWDLSQESAREWWERKLGEESRCPA